MAIFNSYVKLPEGNLRHVIILQESEQQKNMSDE